MAPGFGDGAGVFAISFLIRQPNAAPREGQEPCTRLTKTHTKACTSAEHKTKELIGFERVKRRTFPSSARGYTRRFLRCSAAVGIAALVLLCPSASIASVQAPVRPDTSRTPGAINTNVTQSNIYETICVRGWARTVRPSEEYTYRLKREQLRDWAYSDQRTRDYEEDHLIPLALGGSPTSPKNLWPEPRRGVWNARVKDRLENYLHKQVCAGAISLDTARSEIPKDWIAVYRGYLGDPQ